MLQEILMMRLTLRKMNTNNYIKGLVSVVIPTYKRSDTLLRAVNSVLAQSYKKIEVLVVDDNVPGDEYSKEVEKKIDQLSSEKVQLVKQLQHVNGAKARNEGIKKAIGEYVAFLDDDDFWLPSKIERQVEVLKSCDKKVGAVSTRKIYFTTQGLSHISEKWVWQKSQCVDIMAKKLNVSTCTLLVRRSALDEAGYFDESLYRHQEVQLLSFFSNKFQIVQLDEVLTVIDNSDTGNRPNLEKLIRFKKDYFNSIKPLIEQRSKREQRFIYYNNLTEVAWVEYRDGNRVKGLLDLYKYISNPKVFYTFLQRYFEKKKSRKRLQKYPYKDMILNYLREYEGRERTENIALQEESRR